MKLGKAFSFIILFVVAISSVGFTTLSWYCPMQKVEGAACSSCTDDYQQQAAHDAENGCCKQPGELMKIQPDLSAAVKLQPNVDSPQAEGFVILSEAPAIPTKSRARAHSFVGALPDRVACEHVVLRI